MKKSSQITLGLVATAALAFSTSCHRKPTEAQNCVGADNRIAADSWCEDAERQRRSNPGYFSPYFWRYGGSSGGHIGDTLMGGSAVPTPGANIVRGGLGGTMSSGAHATGGTHATGGAHAASSGAHGAGS